MKWIVFLIASNLMVWAFCWLEWTASTPMDWP